MKRCGLTARQVQHMKPTSKRVEVPAGPPTGLYLIVHASGKKSWALRYRWRGRPKKLTFAGRWPDLSLALARAEAQAALADLQRDIDPAAVKVEEKQSEPDRVEAVAVEWVERYLKPNTRTWREVERLLGHDVLPSWGNKLITEIGRADVLRLVDSIVDSNRPVLANRALSILKRWFTWCVERGILEVSPAATIRPPAKEKSRERVLEADELAEIWKATGSLGFPFGAYFQFLILTAQRRSEVSNIRHEDIDLSAALWTLPPEATKAGRVHDVPLSQAALELLESLPRFDGPFIFTSTDGQRPVSGFSKAKKALDEKILENEGKVAPWRIHDLRRTAATAMASNRVPPHVLSALLNHSAGTAQGVLAIYNRFRYLEERRAALQQWADYLTGLTSEPEQEKGQVAVLR